MHRLGYLLQAEQFALQLKGTRPIVVGTDNGTKYSKSLFLSLGCMCVKGFASGRALAQKVLASPHRVPSRQLQAWLQTFFLDNQHA